LIISDLGWLQPNFRRFFQIPGQRWQG